MDPSLDGFNITLLSMVDMNETLVSLIWVGYMALQVSAIHQCVHFVNSGEKSNQHDKTCQIWCFINSSALTTDVFNEKSV